MTAAGSIPVSALTGDAVVAVGSGETLHTVATLMNDQGIGAVIVGSMDKVEGIVTERDLVRAMAEGKDPTSTTAMSVASTSLVWCEATSTVFDVAEEMLERYIRHVLVEDGGTLVGMISARDILGIYITDEEAG
ncbi:MAG: CBS domain-containing protein [Actinomycetota bacterium]|nr:CBS domain-containing protein [Actinomycetota bacterium]